jgi:prepilin-type N-terminal cleavage/methylation domain-containing protein
MRGVARPLSQAGFTLVELLVVMGLFAILAGMTTVSLIGPQAAAPVSASVNEIVADLKNQQLKAMMGDSGSATAAQPHGVYIQTNQYTLFKGATYSAADADNIVIPAKDGVSLGANFPSSQVVFSKGSGELTSFTDGSNSISVESSISGDVTQIIINRLGAVTIN